MSFYIVDKRDKVAQAVTADAEVGDGDRDVGLSGRFVKVEAESGYAAVALAVAGNYYQTALDVQDACNLSGVLRAFVTVVDAVRAEPGYNGSSYERTHPAVVMFASKIASMIDVETEGMFSKAYAECRHEAIKRGGRG